MKTLKKVALEISEYYLLSLVRIFAFSGGANSVFIALGLAAVILLQLIFKSRVSGIIIACVFILINLYMQPTVTSQFRHFEVINPEEQDLMAVGFLQLVFKSSVAGMILFKYRQKKSRRKTPQTPLENRE